MYTLAKMHAHPLICLPIHMPKCTHLENIHTYTYMHVYIPMYV